MKISSDYRKVVAFHGHSCPGLAIGYRAAKYALAQMGRDQDEEIFAVVENNSCSVDAVQALCSCTFGKGNLLFLDRGKQVFTFFDRKNGKAFRVYVGQPSLPEQDIRLQAKLSGLKNPSRAQKLAMRRLREKRIRAILTAPDRDILKISAPRVKLQPTANIYPSINCSKCGERTMSARMVRRGGKPLCLECSRKKA